jgi:hypothetical protein
MDDIVQLALLEKAPWDTIGIIRVKNGYMCNGCNAVFPSEKTIQIHCALHGRYMNNMIRLKEDELYCTDCTSTVKLAGILIHEQAHIIYTKDANYGYNAWVCHVCGYRQHHTHLSEHTKLHLECPKYLQFVVGSDGPYQSPMFKCNLCIKWCFDLNSAKDHSYTHIQKINARKIRAYTFRMCQKRLEESGECIVLPADSTYDIMKLILAG